MIGLPLGGGQSGRASTGHAGCQSDHSAAFNTVLPPARADRNGQDDDAGAPDVTAPTITPPTAPNSIMTKSGSPSSIQTIRAPIKVLRMEVSEKPRESQMSSLSLMFAALLTHYDRPLNLVRSRDDQGGRGTALRWSERIMSDEFDGFGPSRPKSRANSVTRGPGTSLTSYHWQSFAPPLSTLPMSSDRKANGRSRTLIGPHCVVQVEC